MMHADTTPIVRTSCRSGRRLGRWTSSMLLAIAVAVGSSASTARAAGDDEEAIQDARVTGYEAEKVSLGGGTAGSYALLGVLGAITLGVAFKNARRTHLD